MAGSPPIEHRDVELSSFDGTPLRGRLWSVESPRALLAISHGLGEHGGSYARFAREIAPGLGIEVASFDYRGSGRSQGKRGLVRSYDDLTRDLMAALDWAAGHRPGVPRFLLGHSNGGLVAIRAVLAGDRGLSGLILSNPSLRLSAVVPAWKRAAGQILRRVAPGITLETGLTNDQLTSDPEALAAIQADPLRHDRISAPLYYGMRDAGPEAIARAAEIRLPTLLILGEADPIADPAAGREFFGRLGSTDKTLRAYFGLRHEPLNELGREAVIAEIAGWIDGRIKASESS